MNYIRRIFPPIFVKYQEKLYRVLLLGINATGNKKSSLDERKILFNLINPHILLGRDLGHYIFFFIELLQVALERGNKSVN